MVDGLVCLRLWSVSNESKVSEYALFCVLQRAVGQSTDGPKHRPQFLLLYLENKSHHNLVKFKKKNILHLRSFNKNKLELYYTVDYYRHIFFNTSLIITFFGKFFTISLDMFVWHWRQKHVWLVFFSPMINRKWLQLPPLFIKKNQWKCKIIRFLPSSWFSAKMAKNVIVVRPFKVWKLFFFSCHWLLIMFISIFYRSVN